MAKLFVSYSRKDSVAARKLIEAFKSMEQEVWVDWESIPPAVDWLDQIFRGIEEADAFIFMISPDSIASEVCKVEIGRAVQNNKRVIPIVLRDVAPKDTLESIHKLNWTYIRETDNLEEGLAKVKTAIELDLDWLVEHNRLQVRALEWHRKKDASLLLRGRDLRNAEHMLKTYTSKDPIPTELQQKYIEFSRRTERTRTVMWIVTAFVVVALTILSYIANTESQNARASERVARTQEAEALRQKGLAENYAAIAVTNQHEAEINAQEALQQKDRAEKSALIAEAQRSTARAQIYQTRTGELYTSTLFAIDSLKKSPSEEAEEILRENISLLPIPVAQTSQPGSIKVLELNSDDTTFLSASSDGKTCVRNLNDAKDLFCVTGSTPVNDAIFVRGNQSIAIGYESGLVQVVNAKNGSVEREIEGNSPVRDLDVGPGGRNLAIARANGFITFLNIENPKDKGYNLQLTGKLTVADLSPDGRWYAAGSEGGNVTIWNLDSKKTFSYSHQKGKVLTVLFSPRNRFVISGGEDNYAIGFDIQEGKEVFRLLHSDAVRDIAFSPDGSWFATASNDARVRVWNLFTAQEDLIMFQEGAITNVEISSDGKWITSTGEDNTARVWSAYTGVEMYQIPLESAGTALSFSNDNQRLVTGNENGNMGIWDVSGMNAPTKYVQFNGLVRYSKFTASGDTLVAADAHKVWLLAPQKLATPKSHSPDSLMHDFKNDDITALVTSQTMEMIGISTSGNEYTIFDINNSVQIPVKPAGDSQALAFSANGSLFITGTNKGIVETWDIKSGKQINSFNQGEPILSIAAGPTGVALGAMDKIVLLDANAEQKIAEWQSPGENQFVAFNSDGSLLASANSSGQIEIWRQANNTYTLEYTLVRQQPYSMAFDPQSNRLVVGTINDVYVIDALTGREIDRVHHRGNVYDVSFSPDGKTLATASLKVIQLWDASTFETSKYDDPVQAACSRLISNFSESEWKVMFGTEQPYVKLCENLPIPE